MKALCSERFTDWSTKFGPFGLRCKEVTGDSELDDLYELQSVHVIMTTPVSPTIDRTISIHGHWSPNEPVNHSLFTESKRQ